jgi:hypothetical protein
MKNLHVKSERTARHYARNEKSSMSLRGLICRAEAISRMGLPGGVYPGCVTFSATLTMTRGKAVGMASKEILKNDMVIG